VLHLLAGLKVILSHRLLALLTDSLTPAKSRECLIGELRSCHHQLFMHPHQIAFTARVELQDLFAVGRGFFRTHQAGHDFRSRAQHLAYGAARQLHGSGNATNTMPLLLELQNRGPRALV